MKINRDNYEEYFLLYADDELSAEMRQQVEWFVQQHPDLKAELEMFQGLKMQPDTSIRLENKDFLRKENNALEAELEESLLLHLDGELEIDRVQKLEADIASDARLLKAWESLQITKLPTESIVFPWKESLYRKETRVIPLFRTQWVRYAAAAALILVTGLLWISRPGKESDASGGQIAGQVDLPESLKRVEPSQTGTGTLQEPSQTGTGVLAENNGMIPGGKNQPASDNRAETENQLARAGQAPARFASLPSRPSGKQDMGPEKTPGMQSPGKREDTRDAEQTLIAQAPDKAPSLPVTTEITDQAVGTPEPEVKADYATRALMEGSQHTSDAYQDGEPTRKGPFRGIVRKANRIFHKVTNPDMDKPLVKVASFEIALAN